MPWMVGPDGARHDILPEHVDKASAAGYTHEGDTATVISDVTGLPSDVALEDVGSVVGARAESPAEFRIREDEARKEREHGGIGTAIATGAEAALSSATLGGYDLLGGAIGGDEFRTRRKETEEVHEGAALGGELLGYLAPTGLLKAPGLAGKIARATPVGAIERLGAKIAATGAEKGLLRSAAAKGAGYGLEGAVVGAGETLSDYALATTELERERAAASLSSNVLFGAAVGGGLGAASEVVGQSIRKAKKLADDFGEKMAKRGEGAAEVSGDIAAMDKDALLALKRERGTAIGAEAVEDAKAIASDQSAYRALAGEDFAVVGRARRKLRDEVTNNAKMTSERPSRLLEPLYQEETVLKKALANQDTLLKSAAQRETRLIAQLDDKIKNFKKPLRFKKQDASIYGDVFGKKLTKKGVLLDKAELEEFRAVLQTGAYRKTQREGLEQLPALLETNLAVQAKVKSVVEKTAPAMKEVETALDALKGGGPKKGTLQKMAETGLTGAALSALSPVVGFTGAGLMAGKLSETISDLVMGKLGKAAAKTAKGTSAAVSKFIDAGEKALQRTPPLATKVLLATRYAEKTPPLAATLPKATLVREFKAREAEIYSQVTAGPQGLTMRPQARKNLAERLSGVRAVSPELADSLETIANRKISFLAEKLPKKPDFLAHSVGPDDWHPGNEAIRAFARYVAAVEDPGGVEERLADATITPQDVEAYQAVYPERYAAIRNEIAARLPELQTNLPISKRMALSIFTDLPVEPSMDLAIFSRIQSQFSEEPGTAGGTQAPQATPNFSSFGSVKSQDKTRSQQRAGA